MAFRQPYVSKAKIKIDAHKHDEQIKAIEEARRIEAALAEMEAECEEEEFGEESYEGEEEEIHFEYEDPFQVGRIDLSFPESTEEFKDSDQCYPPSYYTLSPKERLILLYAENFRHQFVINNCKRRPLVLALPNECNVQVNYFPQIAQANLLFINVFLIEIRMHYHTTNSISPHPFD